ncbi:MAG: SDR family NAD(P)-dependent oxidoreductase [Deltaproteobacteria bacterium]|nr:SDR family NAD(P)-dependent oxidoreductase [Deltaproteobacteria bacterium]
MEFENKVAVITGGGGGIGRSMALALAGSGTHTVIADIDEEGLANVKQEIEASGCQALAVFCDVSKDADVDYLAEEAFSTFGRVDFLMNNAGVMLRGYAEKIPMEEWEWILGINLFGVIRGIRAFIPHMIERGSGYVVNTSSLGGLVGGQPFSISYSTSKFAVSGLTEVLYKYLRPKGIGVSLLCPGGVGTNIRHNIRFTGGDDPRDLGGNQNPRLGQPGVADPDDVAQSVITAMKENQFLILTDTERLQAVIQRRNQDLQGFLDTQIAQAKKLADIKKTKEK